MCLVPVSYTHLDVYKRQGYECSQEGITKKLFVEDGAIISDILNVANQAAVLNGSYQNYSIQKYF